MAEYNEHHAAVVICNFFQKLRSERHIATQQRRAALQITLLFRSITRKKAVEDGGGRKCDDSNEGGGTLFPYFNGSILSRLMAD